MTFLSNLFKSKAQTELHSPQVSLTSELLDRAVLRHLDRFEPDNDFNDHIFLTLGIGRMSHLGAQALRYFSHPEQKFGSNLPGSAGAFVVRYKTGWSNKRDCMAVLIRDRIANLNDALAHRHTVAALCGVFNEAGTELAPTCLIRGRIHPRGHLDGLEEFPVTQENATKLVAYMSLNMQQIMDGYRPDMYGNWLKTRRSSLGQLKTLTFED